MLRNLKKQLKKLLIKQRVVASVEIDGILYKIIDRKSLVPHIKNTRSLSFVSDGGLYSHSAIYLNPKHHVQPIFPVPQKLIGLWANHNRIHAALVLGCAGCSVPRFIALSFPHAKITGVELSRKFIEIAHQYFLLDQIKDQFTLIEGDAIEFVKNKTVQNQDVIYIDIFTGYKIIPEIFSKEFLCALYELASETALVIINVFGEDTNHLKSLCNHEDVPFESKHLVKMGSARFLCFIKGTDPKTKEFENDLRNCEDLTVVF